MISRRQFVFSAASLAVCAPAIAGVDHLPLATSFKGQEKFRSIVAKALANNWRALPIGTRMGYIARELIGTPYVGFTLEIDDHVECPSCNLEGLDCWTFFEAVLGFARMLERPRASYVPQHLLLEIQWTRYRAGRCTGNYLERIHYLNEWFIDNEARGTVREISRNMAGAQRLAGRQSREMTVLWKSYRYLRNNPKLLPDMAKIEAAVSALPVSYIPKDKVAGIESQLAEGDIAGIVAKDQGGVCSHVGLILKDAQGRALFCHASKNYKRVTIEGTISGYLNNYRSHAGLMVARPLGVAGEVRDNGTYRRNLKTLTGV